MNSKELFMLIDKIDERFIDEAWSSADSESFDEIDYENRRGVKVVMERKPFHAVWFALTAACFLFLGAGVMSLINLLTGNGIQPNSSMEIPSSYGGSSGNTSTDNSDTGSDVEKIGSYELRAIIPMGEFYITDDLDGKGGVEKLDNSDYAVINVEYTDATEDRPIIAQILKSPPKGGLEPLSDPIYIMGPGTYKIDYKTLRGAGSYSYLFLEYGEYQTDGDNYKEHVVFGTWSP